MKTILALITILLITMSKAFPAVDFDRAFRIIDAPYPVVDSLDLVSGMIQKAALNEIAMDEQKQLLELYKKLSAGYAVNFHYKQAFHVYRDLLELKENVLSRERQTELTNARNQFSKKNEQDLQRLNEAGQTTGNLKSDTESLLSTRSTLKKIFSVIIVLLTVAFAASLFQSGLKLKSLGDELKDKQKKLIANSRLAVMGKLSQGAMQYLSGFRNQANQERELAQEQIKKINAGQLTPADQQFFDDLQKSAN